MIYNIKRTEIELFDMDVCIKGLIISAALYSVSAHTNIKGFAGL